MACVQAAAAEATAALALLRAEEGPANPAAAGADEANGATAPEDGPAKKKDKKKKAAGARSTPAATPAAPRTSNCVHVFSPSLRLLESACWRSLMRSELACKINHQLL